MTLSLSEVKQIIERHQGKPPVQLIPLAGDLGLTVYRVEGWPDNISGRIFRSDELGGSSGYAIEVNAKHSETRRRFTIAHEIAHFALHRPKIGSGEGIYDDAMYRSELTSLEERQANRFAERILMPDHLVRAAANSGVQTPKQLAQLFNVSEQSMAIRLGAPFNA